MKMHDIPDPIDETLSDDLRRIAMVNRTSTPSPPDPADTQRTDHENRLQLLNQKHNQLVATLTSKGILP